MLSHRLPSVLPAKSSERPLFGGPRLSRPTLTIRSRERALVVSLRWMSMGMLPILGVMAVQALRDGISLSVVFWLTALASPVPVLYWARRRLSYAFKTLVFMLSLFAVVLFQECLSGFTPSAALISNTLILLATLLFGERTFRWFLLACLGNLALGWLLHTHGFGMEGAWKFNDPSRVLVWVRHGLVLTFLGGAVREMSYDVRALEQEKLLNEFGGVLASSLNAQQTLAEVSRRVVQHFADLCLIDLKNGGPRQLHVTAREPERAWLAEAIRSWPPNPNEPRLDCEAWRSQRPELVTVTHDYLKQHSQGPEHLALLEAINARSIASVPMMARGHMFGVLVAVSSKRHYDERDLQFLVQVGERAAMALDSASLHAALEQAHADIGARFSELKEAQAKIRTLEGLLPVCAWCGRIRDDRAVAQWKRFEQFVTDHTAAGVSHTICPDCAARHLPARSSGRAGVG